jgi:membrane-associated phospholipid phosphatase
MFTFQVRAITLLSALGLLVLAPGIVHAQDSLEQDSAPPQTAAQSDLPAPETPATPEVVPSKAPERKVSLEPKQSEQGPKGRTTFDIDPIADSALIAVSLGFAGTLELINSTGEIHPQQIAPGFERSQLVRIDRAGVAQTPDPNAHQYSNIGLYVAAGYALLDPILSGMREKNVQTGLADAFMYAEAVSFTLAMTNIVKVAVRRPRPVAYIEAEAHRDDPDYVNDSTDSALSFFSGHAAITATISATATYLAFARAPGTARPWITLLAGTALTTFVSIERVRAGEHFPTDVIAGAIAGAGIGLVVPHLHRTEDIKQRRIWVGFTPLNGHDGNRGGLLNVSGLL